jgi:hypothetical protein
MEQNSQKASMQPIDQIICSWFWNYYTFYIPWKCSHNHSKNKAWILLPLSLCGLLLVTCLDCKWNIKSKFSMILTLTHLNFFQCIFLHKVCMYGVLIKICSIFHNVGFHYNFELNMLVIMFPNITTSYWCSSLMLIISFSYWIFMCASSIC